MLQQLRRLSLMCNPSSPIRGAVVALAATLTGLVQERLPLAVDAALALGCCAGVGAAARGRPLTEGFDCAELEVSSTAYPVTAPQHAAYGMHKTAVSHVAVEKPCQPPLRQHKHHRRWATLHGKLVF